jgi:hypothetical protein
MHLQPPRPFVLFLSIIFLITSLPGCGGPARTEVTGQVKYNGQPIDRKGTISFLGADGVPISAEIDTSGNYHASGVCLGENKVSVVYTRSDEIPPKGRVKGRVPDPNKPIDVPAATGPAFLIPDTFAAPESSGLKVTIEKSTVYSPELTGPPIK